MQCSFAECVCWGRRGGEGADRCGREGLRAAAEELDCRVPVADWRWGWGFSLSLAWLSASLFLGLFLVL
jgi:hypothetical protein